MNAAPKKPTDRNIFARLSRRKLALTPDDAQASPATATATSGVAIIDGPEDDNFYFETSIASPAVQLTVWELINDQREPLEDTPDDDELDDGVLAPGHTATVAFWAGERGQELLHAWDEGPSGSFLGGWLAETFPNLYGPSGEDLDGTTNSDVAAVVRRLSCAVEPRLEAQVLALALAAYATREFLGGDAAAPFGFRVTPLGVSACLCNVGPLGAPFQAANGSSLTVLHILNVLDAQTVGGIPLAGNDTLRQQAHDVLDLVNRFGDV
ncbi:MAG: hypothetical protein P4L84_26255 [Isosphaeraceae bacterium]|nr:hypothetical protein [Isosphaeraceae bacterium]